MKRDEILKAIEEKYDKLGVPVDAMLEGLLHSTPLHIGIIFKQTLC